MRHWLLTLRAGSGRLWRLTSAPEGVTVTDPDGRPIPFEPGLDAPTPTEGADDPDGAEIPISALLPLDAWRAIADADDLCDWTAELALWAEGETWARRRVWIDGRVDQPVYGNAGVAVQFSIVEAPWEDRGQIPPPEQAVVEGLWFNAVGGAMPEEAIGKFYPWVFGAPGLIYSGDAITAFNGWPGLLIQVDATSRNNFSGALLIGTVVVAGHRMVASNILVINRTTGLSAQVSLSTTTDSAGTVVTVAEVDGGDLQISEGDELWLSCVDATEGGYPAENGGVARGAGALIDLLLRRSTIRYDLAQRPQLSRLDAFRLDFVINSPVNPWAIITDRILDGGRIPAFWRRSGAGYWLAVQPFEDALLQTAPALNINPDLDGGELDGTITVSSGAEVTTDLILRYGYDDGVGQMLRQTRMVPTPTEGTVVSPWLAAAWARIKIRRTLEIEAPAIQDPATAALILGLEARRRGSVRRSAAWLTRQDDRMQPGAVVAVTDAEVRWSSRRCWITSISPASEGGWMRVAVETLPDLLRLRGSGG